MLSWSLSTAFLTVVLVSWVHRFYSHKRQTANLPGLRSLIGLNLVGALIPTSRFNLGLNWYWKWRNQVYQRVGCDTISIIGYLFGTPALCTISIEVSRQVLNPNTPWRRSPETSAILMLRGQNILSANDDEWRRHLRVIGPGFSTKLYDLVWRESSDLMGEIAASGEWDDKEEVYIPAVNEMTARFALSVIARCGFGLPMHWDTESDLDGDSQDDMVFGRALGTVSDSFLLRLITPRWMYWLPIRRLQEIEKAYTWLRHTMTLLIAARREEFGQDPASETRQDLFSKMVQASQKEGKLAMSDDELIGNTFLMLFAGHDTTAKALDATLGFLALYQDIQDEVFQELAAVLEDDPELSFAAYNHMHKLQACFMEAARLFPGGLVMFRDATEDVILKTDNPGSPSIALQKGTRIIVDTIGMHYNPRYFPEPEEYRPSRWYDAPESDLTMFSMGSRACLGRRFALTETACFLAKMLQRWRVDVVLENGESREEWRKRVMVGFVSMAFGVGTVPVRLVKRPRPRDAAGK
ncbi:cytochrome P450 [Amylostereum chailletii]|nr:cytochrome P450 [Amylostereum chailletii]